MKIKKVQSVCLILVCIAATGLIGCGKTDETSKKHEAITFMAPYLEVDSFIEEVHKTYPQLASIGNTWLNFFVYSVNSS